MEAEKNARPKGHRRIGIKWKMFMILFAFVSVFVVAIWLFQIQMLHYFYQTAKFNELDKVAEEIESSLGDDNRLISVVETSADEFSNMKKGVKLINLKDGVTVASIAKVRQPEADEIHEETVEETEESSETASTEEV